MMLIKGNEVTIIVIIQQNWVDLKFAPNKNNNNYVVDMELMTWIYSADLYSKKNSVPYFMEILQIVKTEMSTCWWNWRKGIKG